MSGENRSILRSPAIGTSTSDLISPCRGPSVPRRKPDPIDDPIAVALSGGGFRATLAGLGVLRLLADADMLQRVRWLSSVSGGSVACGLMAVHLPELRKRGWSRAAFDELVLAPFVESVGRRSIPRALLPRAWRLLGRTTRTDLLEEEFDRRYFHGVLLENLDPSCRFVINAANTSTGVRFGFEREAVGDYVIGDLPTAGSGLRLAAAVAASAAVPGLLAPVVLDLPGPFPCQNGRTVRLVDGGVYDNMGLEPVDDLPEALLVAVNAGGLFVTGRYGRIPLVRDLELAQSLLYRQSTAVRRRWMVERFRAREGAADEDRPAWGRRGVLFGLTSTIPEAALSAKWTAVNPQPPDPEEVGLVPTSFDRFDRDLCRRLIHAGWWLAGATLASYHPDQVPEVPEWSWELG
jgi:NTE family protein